MNKAIDVKRDKECPGSNAVLVLILKNMTIGFANGVFYRLRPDPLERFSREFLCYIRG